VGCILHLIQLALGMNGGDGPSERPSLVGVGLFGRR
jgi:hypothetical protein